MSIAIGTRVIADVRLISPPQGIPGIGFSRLHFPLEVQMQPLPGPPAVLEHLIGKVSAGRPGGPTQPLGKAIPQSSWFASTFDYGRNETISLELDLAGERLEALERLRAGGPLVFQFDLSLHVRRGDQVQPAFERVSPLLVNVSAWVQVLDQLGYLDLLIVAMELPLSAPGSLANAIQEMRAAHGDLLAGRYDSTVMRCRRAMESVDASVPNDANQGRLWRMLKEDKEARDAMTKSERAELVRMAVRHYSHLAAHVDENGAPECFSRHDALFILTAAAGVIWEAVARA